MLVVRSILFNVLFYLALIVIMLVGLPTMLAGPAAVKELARIWGRTSLWLLRVVCGTRVEFRGLHHIPPGGCMVAAKHQSVWDVFVLPILFDDFSFVLKRELIWIPLFGWYLARSGQVAIDRAKGRMALARIVRQARPLIGRGGQLFIFPEGTRRPPGAPPSYKFGAAFMYTDLKVPCVPVALNSGLFWPRRKMLRRPGTVVLEVLEPIAPGLTAAQFLPLVQERIETASDRLLDEAVAADPSLRAVIASGAAAAAPAA